MAEKRTYEVFAILEPKVTADWVSTFNTNVTELVEKLGGTITHVNDMGVRKLAYKIEKNNEGRYVMFEIDGSGQEVAELERRFRVNDSVVRYMTVRVDLERRRADKFKAKRTARAERRGQASARKAEARAAAAEASE